MSYAAHGNAARAYREAFDVEPDTRANTVAVRAFELRHRPEIAERIRQLQAAAAKGTTIDVRTRMLWLEDIRTADPCEVVRVVAEPCPSCWPETTQDAPRADCADCHGEGIARVKVTPTELLSAGARRLVRSIRQKASGEIEVRLHDQLEAVDMLNRMQGVYVDRSLSVTAHTNLPDFASMTPEQQADFIRSLAPP